MESVPTLAEAPPLAPAPVITRFAGWPVLNALHFTSWQQAGAELDIDDFEAQVIVSDLLLGAWKGHWIAYELQKQLALPANKWVQPMLNEGNYADTVGKLIDNESEGDKNFRLALKSCALIRDALRQQNVRHVCVIPPKAEYSWEPENLQLLKLLQESLADTDIQLTLLLPTGISVSLPEGWPLRYLNSPVLEALHQAPSVPYFPGILDQATAQDLGLTTGPVVKVKNGFYAPDPLARSMAWPQPDLAYLWSREEHLAAAFQLSFATPANQEIIEREALRRFAEGAYGIAMRLLSSLLPRLTGVNREYVRIQLQNIRIALMDFGAAAAEEAPTADLPDLVKASLSQSKAWGLVMSNRPAEAEVFFTDAQSYLDAQAHPRLYLYLLNITALNKLRLGNTAAAFVLEKQIESSLNQQAARDWHITYVNNINQARLYKKTNQFAEAEQYYHRAFVVNTQLKNESDLLYSNLCFAQLEELKGCYPTAFLFWLRTCIHWLSNDAPEALAPRVAQAILHKNLSGQSGEVEEISQQLCRSLVAAAQKIGLAESAASPICNFVRPENSTLVPDLIAGQPGWGIGLCETQTLPCYDGPGYNHLRKQVSAYLQQQLPEAPWHCFPTVIADTQVFCELPATPTELLLVALRLRVPRLLFNDKLFLISPGERASFLHKAKVSLSPAINFVRYRGEQLEVFFKRYLPSRLLSGPETKVMQQVQATPGCVLEQAGAPELLFAMEQHRLLQLHL